MYSADAVNFFCLFSLELKLKAQPIKFKIKQEKYVLRLSNELLTVQLRLYETRRTRSVLELQTQVNK